MLKGYLALLAMEMEASPSFLFTGDSLSVEHSTTTLWIALGASLVLGVVGVDGVDMAE